LGVLLATPAAALDPGSFDITVYANEDYVLNLTHTANGVPVNLTGYTFKLQSKKTSGQPFLTMSTAITNAAAGQTRHWLTKAATRNNANTAGSYDLMQTAPDGKVTYRLKGNIRILDTVTR
jgi:hypothetical protein